MRDMDEIVKEAAAKAVSLYGWDHKMDRSEEVVRQAIDEATEKLRKKISGLEGDLSIESHLVNEYAGKLSKAETEIELLTKLLYSAKTK